MRERGPESAGPCYDRALRDEPASSVASTPHDEARTTTTNPTAGVWPLVGASLVGAIAWLAGSDAPREAALHLGFGALAGTYGALIGAGGGFLIVPFLLIVDALPPERAAGTSLVAVCVGAIAATLLALRGRRVDREGALTMGAATLPGAVVGASVSASLDPRLFGAVFGAAMIALALWLARRGSRAPARPPPRADASRWTRTRVDVDGVRWRYDLRVGLAASAGIGLVSSVLGIGGGVLHVPLMIGVLAFPEATAVATSQAILAASSAVGLAGHAALGHVDVGRAAPLALGALFGAAIARVLAPSVRGPRLVRLLSAALGLVGARLLSRSLLG